MLFVKSIVMPSIGAIAVENIFISLGLVLSASTAPM